MAEQCKCRRTWASFSDTTDSGAAWQTRPSRGEERVASARCSPCPPLCSSWPAFPFDLVRCCSAGGDLFREPGSSQDFKIRGGVSRFASSRGPSRIPAMAITWSMKIFMDEMQSATASLVFSGSRGENGEGNGRGGTALPLRRLQDSKMVCFQCPKQCKQRVPDNCESMKNQSQRMPALVDSRSRVQTNDYHTITPKPRHSLPRKRKENHPNVRPDSSHLAPFSKPPTRSATPQAQTEAP